MSPRPRRPTRAEIEAAAGRTVPDVIAPGLRVLFCGINPGLYTAAVGHHFARPGNRFWPALHAAGVTDRLLLPSEEQELLKSGYGITNVVERAATAAAEVSADELAEGGRRLEQRVCQYQPRILAVLGIGAYRTAFGRPKAVLGQQREVLGRSMLWVLPNPSGLNAHYRPDDFARCGGRRKNRRPADREIGVIHAERNLQHRLSRIIRSGYGPGNDRDWF